MHDIDRAMFELSGETSDKEADAMLPSLLLQKRLAAQQRSA